MFWRRPPVAPKKRPIDYDLAFYSKVASRAAGGRSGVEKILAFVRETMFLLLFAYFGWCLWDRNVGAYPTTIEAVRVLNPKVEPGKKIYVYFAVTRHQVCEYDAFWTVTDSTGYRQRFQDGHMDAAGVPGPSKLVRGFIVPSDVHVGPATLSVATSWSCPWNVYESLYPKTRVLPDLHFDVVEASQ